MKDPWHVLRSFVISCRRLVIRAQLPRHEWNRAQCRVEIHHPTDEWNHRDHLAEVHKQRLWACTSQIKCRTTLQSWSRNKTARAVELASKSRRPLRPEIMLSPGRTPRTGRSPRRGTQSERRHTPSMMGNHDETAGGTTARAGSRGRSVVGGAKYRDSRAASASYISTARTTVGSPRAVAAGASLRTANDVFEVSSRRVRAESMKSTARWSYSL